MNTKVTKSGKPLYGLVITIKYIHIFFFLYFSLAENYYSYVVMTVLGRVLVLSVYN